MNRVCLIKLKAKKNVSKEIFSCSLPTESDFDVIWLVSSSNAVWYCIGILIKFSEKFAGLIGVVGEVKVGFAIMYAYIGLCW